MRILKKIFISILICLTLSSCATARSYTAYTVYPIGYLLNRIAGNRLNTISIQNNALAQIATIDEDFVETLSDSIVLFHIGDLEPYLNLYSEDIEETGVDIEDLSILNALYEYKRYIQSKDVNGKITYQETSYYDGDVFDDIDYYDIDPFIWLSPIGMLSMAKDINEYLCSNYFEQSTYFNENYEKLADELISLDASYNTLANQLVNENKNIKFVSMTGSFGCWQKDYGIEVYPICLSKFGALPSDEQLEIIKKRIVNDGVKYIAYEPNMSDEMVSLFEEIEKELGLKRVTLSNISSLTVSQSESNKDYMSLMYENLSVLQSMAESNDVSNAIITQ